MNKTVTIHINGCTVTVPADQEQRYREILADKYFNGYKVYVENNEVRWTAPKGVEGTAPETLRQMLLDQNRKNYALRGTLYEF